MSRIGLTAAIVAALALAVPGAALGHGPSRHHKRHHHRTITHIRQIRPANPTAPTTTAPSDNAATVASFTHGVLTLTLNDGSTVAAKVTDATEITCDTPGESDETGSSGQGDAADHHSDGDPGDSAGNGADENGDSGGVDNDDTQATTCNSTSLVPGAIVHEAEVRISSAGATFSKVELVK
jgi:hypothetical protein